jgi:hypothetical protein
MPSSVSSSSIVFSSWIGPDIHPPFASSDHMAAANSRTVTRGVRGNRGELDL